MRMEELSDNRYIKGADTVEKYLLDLIRKYFKESDIAQTTSREFIIRKAVTRMKEEFRYENIGVLSITLADNIPRTGPITISAADINAEPIIEFKRSAFNVDFGDKANTACEGNDPRLSDARTPKPHTHSIQEINGLEGQLSTIYGLLTRSDAFKHKHDNIDVLNKLIYTGTARTIDLSFLDTTEPKIDEKIKDIQDKIDSLLNTEIPDRINTVNANLEDIQNSVEEAKSINEAAYQDYLRQAKSYTDSKVPDVLNQVNNYLDGYVTKAQLSSSAAEAISYIGSMLLTGSMLKKTESDYSYSYFEYEAAIPDNIIETISNHGTSLHDSLIDMLIRHTKDDGTYEWNKMPFYYINTSGTIEGMLVSSIDYDTNKIKLIYRAINMGNSTLPDEIKQTRVELKFYAK